MGSRSPCRVAAQGCFEMACGQPYHNYAAVTPAKYERNSKFGKVPNGENNERSFSDFNIGMREVLGLRYQTNFLRSVIPNHSEISKHWLPVQYHVHIWHVSSQISCGDTSQIWTRFKVSYQHFCLYKIPVMENLTKWASVTKISGGPSQYKDTVLSVQIKRSPNRLNFTMKIFIHVKTVFLLKQSPGPYTETGHVRNTILVIFCREAPHFVVVRTFSKQHDSVQRYAVC